MFARVSGLLRKHARSKGKTKARQSRRGKASLRVEQLEPRTLLAAPAVGTAKVVVQVREMTPFTANPSAYDQVFISYRGPAKTYLRRVVIDFDVTLGGNDEFAVAIERLEGRRVCSWGDDPGTPKVLSARRARVQKMSWGRGDELPWVTAETTLNQLWVQFARPRRGPTKSSLDSGDYVVLGVDFDWGVERGESPGEVFCVVDIVTGKALSEGTVYAFLGGPVLPTVLSGRFRQVDKYTAKAVLTTNFSAARPLTAVVHGYFLPPYPPGVPKWAKRIGNALLARGFSQRDILLFNWSRFSRQHSPGWAEQAGAHLTGVIMKRLLRRNEATDVQLIGFSRGAVVISEAARRLIALRRDYPALRQHIRRVSVHYLDAHPARAGEPMDVTAEAVRRLIEEKQRQMQDSLPQAWRGLYYASALYQRNPVRDAQTGAVCAGSSGFAGAYVNLHGRPVEGAMSWPLLISFDLPPHPVALPCHGEMPNMYLRTVREPEDWYGGWAATVGHQNTFQHWEVAAFRQQWSNLPRATYGRKIFNGDLQYVTPAFWEISFARDYIPGFNYRSRYTIFERHRGVKMSYSASFMAELVVAPPGTRYFYFDVVDRSRRMGKFATLRVSAWELAFGGKKKHRIAAIRLRNLREGTRYRVDLARVLNLRKGGVLNLSVNFSGLLGWIKLGNFDLG
jgi:hypothetical protein